MMIPNEILGNAYELADDGYIVRISHVKRPNPFGDTWGEEYRCKALTPDEVTGPLIWRVIEESPDHYGNRYLMAIENSHRVFIKRDFERNLG